MTIARADGFIENAHAKIDLLLGDDPVWRRRAPSKVDGNHTKNCFQETPQRQRATERKYPIDNAQTTEILIGGNYTKDNAATANYGLHGERPISDLL